MSLQGSLKSEEFTTVREPEDDSDVLIECRDVYKSFGEKHILRGLSFKVNQMYYFYLITAFQLFFFFSFDDTDLLGVDEWSVYKCDLAYVM